jgi:hypothetical protein
MTMYDKQARSWRSRAGSSVWRRAVLVLLVAGFPAPLYSADLLHQYDFNGNLADSLATGVAMEQYANVATSAYSSDGWSWTANTNPGGGLKLETALISDTQSYSLGFRVKYGNVTGYRKIISFKGTTDDNGLYFLNGNLEFYPFGPNASVTYAVDTFYDFIFSRSSDDVIRVYTVDSNGNATKVYEQNDSTDASVPVVVNGKGQFLFFCDDASTNTEWTSSGTVKRVRVWNGPLEEGEVSTALSDETTEEETGSQDEPENGSQSTSWCINWPLSVLFRTPICGFGCLMAMAATLAGLSFIKLGARARRRRRSAICKR